MKAARQRGTQDQEEAAGSSARLVLEGARSDLSKGRDVGKALLLILATTGSQYMGPTGENGARNGAQGRDRLGHHRGTLLFEGGSPSLCVSDSSAWGS